MYILYLDESGDPDNPNNTHFVLGGAAIFERQTFHISNEFEAIQARRLPGLNSVVFHTDPIRSGRGQWRKIEKERRALILQDIGNVIATANDQGLALFSVAVEMNPSFRGDAVIKRAIEEICNRFDIYLKRLYNDGNAQRGLIVLAESRYHKNARIWIQGFRELGTQWGIIRNMSDIPFYATPAETRLLQLADYVAHAVYRFYQHRDSSLARPILHRFDHANGVMHGLSHIKAVTAWCDCPACASRQTPGTRGSWV